MDRGFQDKCTSLTGARVLGTSHLRKKEFQMLLEITLEKERKFNLVARLWWAKVGAPDAQAWGGEGVILLLLISGQDFQGLNTQSDPTRAP